MPTLNESARAGENGNSSNNRPAGPLADYHLLEGPHSRTSELVALLQIFWDYLSGMRVLHFVGPCVTVFGSARTPEASPHYQTARAMGAGIAEMGFTVLTGGGPGIMEAANRGAREAGGRSIGCNIRLPVEQQPNPYLDRWVDIRFFSVRKTLLIKYSYAFVVCPGGFGTVDELFEALTLIQTGKLKNFPLVLMDTEYWADLLRMMERMVAAKTVGAPDLNLIYATNSVEDALRHIREKTIAPFGLVPVVRRHFPWLLERGIYRARRIASERLGSVKAAIGKNPEI